MSVCACVCVLMWLSFTVNDQASGSKTQMTNVMYWLAYKHPQFTDVRSTQETTNETFNPKNWHRIDWIGWRVVSTKHLPALSEPGVGHTVNVCLLQPFPSTTGNSSSSCFLFFSMLWAGAQSWRAAMGFHWVFLLSSIDLLRLPGHVCCHVSSVVTSRLPWAREISQNSLLFPFFCLLYPPPPLPFH